jgi:trk system potassium uptake protein
LGSRGCGRVGVLLATDLAVRGDEVAVVDRDPRMLERLGERFAGRRVEGVGFDRDTLEVAGVARADALVAVTGGDNSNIVTARVARDVYRVPRVIARIQDLRRAEIYEQLGVTTVSSVGWTLRKMRDYLEHRPLTEETAFGRGEVSLLRIELPQHLVDRKAADLEADGLRIISVTRHGGAFVPTPDTVLAEGDVLRVVVGDTGRTRLDGLLRVRPRRPHSAALGAVISHSRLRRRPHGGRRPPTLCRRPMVPAPTASRSACWWPAPGCGAPTSPTT